MIFIGLYIGLMSCIGLGVLGLRTVSSTDSVGETRSSDSEEMPNRISFMYHIQTPL
jgi:hypothetical protein